MLERIRLMKSRGWDIRFYSQNSGKGSKGIAFNDIVCVEWRTFLGTAETPKGDLVNFEIKRDVLKGRTGVALSFTELMTCLNQKERNISL